MVSAKTPPASDLPKLAALVGELREFVRIPSVSGDPLRAGDVRRCAEWLAAQLRRAGFQRVVIARTPRHPIVYAHWLGAAGGPTVLIYGHYDVQPAREADGWRRAPFDAVVKDGHLHGRGASDDKGQLFTHIKAVESLLRVRGRLPVNVKCIFEGEEEIGSPNLPAFLTRNRRVLAADVALVSDTRMLGPDQPALTCSLRGQLAMELEVRGPGHDLHSGNYGGVVHDPLQALCEIVARLHDSRGRVTVPGFYDRVRKWSASEREAVARNAPSGAAILRETGVPRTWGERGFNVAERLALRPSLAITGIVGGHAGEGPKAVIPARAVAKLSFRLVPDQDPREIERLFRAHLVRITPPTVRTALRLHFAAWPAVIDPRHPAMRAAARAYSHGFGRAPVLIHSGGSIPAVSEFQRVLGIPTVLMGFASPSDGLHGPNEKFSIQNFQRGIATSRAFLHELARAMPRPAAAFS